MEGNARQRGERSLTWIGNLLSTTEHAATSTGITVEENSSEALGVPARDSHEGGFSRTPETEEWGAWGAVELK